MKSGKTQKFGDVLKLWVEGLEKRTKLDEVLVQRVWAKRMGKTINGYTKEIRLVRGKVYIQLTSAPLKQEMDMNRDKIKDMFNRAFQDQVVDEVIIK
mgnify:CR=1 FL=1|jgi:hypothetical protein